MPKAKDTLTVNFPRSRQYSSLSLSVICSPLARAFTPAFQIPNVNRLAYYFPRSNLLLARPIRSLSSSVRA
jgi:hypothetical protein